MDFKSARSLTFVSALIMAAFLTAFTGCAADKSQAFPVAALASASASDDGRTLYTNLAGEESLIVLNKLFSSAGLTDTADFMASLKAFNDIMPAQAGLEGGFTDASGEDKADLGAMSEAWSGKHPGENDINCRLAAFELMKDKVFCGTDTDDYGDYLMFDVDALENDSRYKALLPQKSVFISLFDQISSKGLEPSKYAEAFAEALASRGVKYSGGNAHIVSVLMYDPDEQVLFVGHAGVLIVADGYCWLLEKLAPFEPFRLTRYSSLSALAKDIRSRPGYADGQSGAAGVLIDDKVCV